MSNVFHYHWNGASFCDVYFLVKEVFDICPFVHSEKNEMSTWLVCEAWFIKPGFVNLNDKTEDKNMAL